MPEQIDLDEAMAKACEHLPEGWVIELNMENGSAWVVLQSLTEQIDIDPDDQTIAEQIVEAINIARRRVS